MLKPILTFAVLATSLQCFAQSNYPHREEAIADVRSVYDGQLLPDEAVNTFRNIDRLFSTRTVSAGGQVDEIPERSWAWEELRFQSGEEEYDVYDYVTANRVTGLLVLKNGENRLELYQEGNSEATRWMSMSIAKSITATLIGVAINDGLIDSLDSQLTDYLPQLRDTAYDGVTVRNVLQMASGASWNETYTDSSSDRRQLLEAQIAQQPDAMLRVMAALPRAAEPGSLFTYSTG